MSPIYLHYLNALDVEALALTDDEILAAIEAGLAAQGRGETVIEPRVHLVPDASVPGHFNVLRGSFRAPINLAGVKVISDYVDNYKEGLPSEVGLLLLMDPRNGVPNAIIVPYGTMSAVELSLTDIMSKMVVDDWGQCKSGQFGSLRAHVEAGKLSEATLHAEIGEIVAGRKPGRQRDDETILFWHRGLSLSDIAIGHAMLEKAARLGIGHRLRYA